MDSYPIFVELFKQAAFARNFKALLDIFEQGESFFAIVSLEHRGKYQLYIIFYELALNFFENYKSISERFNQIFENSCNSKFEIIYLSFHVKT